MQGANRLSFKHIISKARKTITIKGEDFKKVSSYISEIFVKLKAANFPIVFEEKFKMINEEVLLRQYELNSQTDEYKHVVQELHKSSQNL